MNKLERVPDERVGEVVQSFVRDGITTIHCEKVGDNNWTITATRG